MADHFHLFARAVHERFNAMATDELFTVDAGDLYETYLAAYPAGSNPIFRERTEHDCSACKNFVRNIGHVVSLAGGHVHTVWSIAADLPHPYNIVAARMDEVVRQLPVNSVYRTKERRYGAERNVEVKDGQVREWRHFFCDVPTRNKCDNPDQVRGEINTAVHVFQRGLSELSIGALETVLELIDAGSLYRGAEKRHLVVEFLNVKRAYLTADDKTLFAWANAGSPATRFRSDVIGTLVSDLSEGVDMEKAVRLFESKVAPTNYKRTSTLITPRMIEQAVTQLRALGLESAVERRMARLSDVSVNNVLFVDNAVRPAMRDGNLTDMLMSAVKPATPDLKHATPITIDDFMASVVPTASSIDLLVQNRHVGNFVTLTAPVHADDAAAKLFRWDNGFAWSYDGDVADSIKQRVKRAGGNVDAPLRVSLAWHNADDLDLHAQCPDGHVYYSSKKGILDVDMNGIDRHDAVAPVENLSWRQYRDGNYRIHVHQFHLRNRENYGFEIEFHFNGETHNLSWSKPVTQGMEIPLVSFTIDRGQMRNLAFGPGLVGGNASQSVWSVSTETLVPVNTLMHSPNHWDGHGVGQKHWFFMLKGCKNPAATRGIYNEFLNPALEPHRKVFEILGSKTKCQPTDDQLSGVGFTAARGDTVTAVVKGRAFNIQF
jgi:hypothetical protein